MLSFPFGALRTDQRSLPFRTCALLRDNAELFCMRFKFTVLAFCLTGFNVMCHSQGLPFSDGGLSLQEGAKIKLSECNFILFPFFEQNLGMNEFLHFSVFVFVFLVGSSLHRDDTVEKVECFQTLESMETGPTPVLLFFLCVF